jgi:hypothetical protein
MPDLAQAAGLPSNILKMARKSSIAYSGAKKNADLFGPAKNNYVIFF